MGNLISMGLTTGLIVLSIVLEDIFYTNVAVFVNISVSVMISVVYSHEGGHSACR